MPCPPRPRRRLLPAIPLLALSACFRPSYSRDKVAEHVQDICRREYKMDVTARFVEKNTKQNKKKHTIYSEKGIV